MGCVARSPSKLSSAGSGPGLTRDAMAAWGVFLRAHATLVDLLERELQGDQGLPLTWFDVLAQLASAPDGRLRMQELAVAIVLSKSGLTRLVDRLESAGLVERVTCPSDRRGTFAVLTVAGRQALTRAQPVVHQAIEQHFAAQLGPAEINTLGTALTRVVDALAVHATGGAFNTGYTSDGYRAVLTSRS
jgi:DNA-binding MarR family transcriptional regulator